MRLLPRRRRRLVLLAAALFAAWLGGLAAFVVSSLTMADAASARADAIVVLTGGRWRLEAGLQLLAAGRAHKLFISGVNQKVDREALLRALGPAAQRVACCIVLGHAADNTEGNAVETAAWMRREGYHSLLLVTSWYHMRRSLLEFGRTMPQIEIIPQPVFASRFEPDDRWRWQAAVPLVVGEYDKYLAASLRSLVEAAWAGPPAAALRRTAAAGRAPPGARR